MSDSRYIIPNPNNEPVKSYAPDSEERVEVKKAIETLKSEELDIPMIINGREIRTNNKKRIHPPHDIKSTLGYFHEGNEKEVIMAIKSALDAKQSWMELDWGERATIFLKAADMLAGSYRSKIIAATMLGQSKNVHQAEIDAACELIDFYRFNVKYLEQIYEMQPNSSPQQWNSIEWRPLEGFIFALTPFNFTSIAGNLQTSAAMMGNTIVWKPSRAQIYSAAVTMEVLMEAGLPNGVINMVFTPGPLTADIILSSPDFTGVHFTGSTGVFHSIWEKIGKNIRNYKTYPRIVGETGGKDFVFVHESANIKQVITALTRGAFEYQGQKCSAASRAYIPKSKWAKIKEGLESDLKSMKMGSPEDFGNFINAVIDENAFKSLSCAIEKIHAASDAEIVIGGNYDDSSGYFIEPTVVLTTNPKFFSMEEELFGPILTVYLYDEDKYEETLKLCDQTSVYALTGSIFARDRAAVVLADKILRFAAGNFYINDKPTGAVVGQQPFGGARQSGTNDKAGSIINLMRWVSPRTIKENFAPSTDYRYPFLGDNSSNR